MPSFRHARSGVTLLLACTLASLASPRLPAASGPFAAELGRLHRRLIHATPGSAGAFKLQQKVDKINAWLTGRPMPDNPGEFARILAEMKIPADATVSQYEPGYQRRELEKAEQLRARRGAFNGTLPWISRGPGNVAGRARGIVVDPDDATNNTWFIASVGGGVWKTTDAGATWQWLTPDFPVLSTSTIAMAPSNHDVLYVGTGESFYNVDTINGDGILKSTDRGATWTPLASTVGNPAFNNIARIIVDPTDPNVVLAAATRGRFKEYLNPRSSIFRSTDGGATWTEVYASTTISGGRVQKIQQLVADPTDFNILYATVEKAGILKSTNRGLTWSFVNTGITIFAGRFELAISPVDHLRLFASAEGTSHSELWVSTNGGTSWSRTTASGSEPNWLGSQGWYDNTIVSHPVNPNVVYVGGIYLWRLTLSGTVRSATFLSSSVHPDQHGLVILNPTTSWRILNTNDGGVSVTTSGDAGWTQIVDGLVTTQFYGIDKRPGASAYVGGTQDNGTWQSPTDPNALNGWTAVIGGDGYETSWHFDDPQKIIGGYQYNGLERSLDGGATWSSAITSVSPAGTIDNGAGNAPFITKIAHTPADPERLFAVGRQGVWRSSDFGATWSLTAIPSGTWGPISSFHCIRISRANPSVIYAGSRMDGTGQLVRSVDGGLNFTALPNYTTVTLGGISGLATDPGDANTAYALFGIAQRPKILKTTNGGLNWQDISGFEASPVSTNGFPDVAVYDLLVFSNDSNHLWAATEIGLVESLDGGVTWALADNGLPNVSIWQLAEVEDEVVAATHGRGIWSVSMPELVDGKTFNPLIERLCQRPDGQMELQLNLRSEYDSTTVYVDGSPIGSLPANVAHQSETMVLPVVSAGTRSVSAVGYRFGWPYNSVTRTLDVFAPQTPVLTYLNDFESPTGDFIGSLFTIGGAPGFSGSAIQSPHPYSDSSSPVYTLTVPIYVAMENATIEFDEVALVEPGDPGSVFGDSNFWDYVIVEGSLDGCNWTSLAPGWDCRDYSEWETAFNNSTDPTSAMLHHRTIDLHDTYATNDLILIRFRLFADGAVNGWGWIIDNLKIQEMGVSAVGPTGAAPALQLAQNLPNPMSRSTVIRYSLPKEQPVSLEIFDIQGRRVRELVSGRQAAGAHDVAWDGRDSGGRDVVSGVYFYRMATGGKVLKQKLVVRR